jgi:hypothetical protein
MNDLIAAASSSTDNYGILCKIYLELETKVYGKNIKLKSGNIKLETPSSFFKKAMYIAGGTAALAGAGYAGYKLYKEGGDFKKAGQAILEDAKKAGGFVVEGLKRGYKKTKDSFSRPKSDAGKK